MGRPREIPSEISRLRLARNPRHRPKDVLEVLFHTKHSRAVAAIFLEYMVENGGVVTRDEMGRFVTKLESGALSVVTASGAFYGRGGVLRVLEDLGLVGRDLRHAGKGRSLNLCYVLQHQSLGECEPPPQPSIIRNAWIVANLWNERIDRIRAATEA